MAADSTAEGSRLRAALPDPRSRTASMKRPVLALSAVVTLVCAVPSQAKVRPGVELGANVSSLKFDDMDSVPLNYWDTSSHASFTGGLTFEIPFADRLAIQTGLRYVQQGNRVHYDDGTLRATFRFAQDYVSVPVLLGMRLLPSDRFSISIGPEVSFLVAANVITEENSLAPSTSQSIRHDIQSTNVLLDVAAGYDFPLQRRTGTVGVRYTRGLTGVAKQDRWVSDWKTQGIEALVGLRFGAAPEPASH